MTKNTVIKTCYDRELAVKDYGHDFNLCVKDTDGTYAVKGEVYTSLNPKEAADLANALLGENATVVTDLPEAKPNEYGEIQAGSYYRSPDADPETVMSTAKALLSIHAFIVKRDTEKAAEEAKAKEAARAKRRNELATEFRGYGGPTAYSASTGVFKAAIDRIIDLEEAAKV